MQQWEQAYNKWFMANYEPKIQNSLDKHSELSNFEMQRRLQDTHKEFEQQMFMRYFFKTLYQKQGEEKGVIKIDAKQAEQEISKVIEDLQSIIDKKL